MKRRIDGCSVMSREENEDKQGNDEIKELEVE
jgi:hypothetical protein